jgi:putative nucleotidyltransferase with HDIG domain
MTNRPQEPRPERRGKLLYLLLFALIVTGFVPLSFLATNLIKQAQEELQSTLREKQLLVADAIEDALDQHVEAARVRVHDLSESFGVLAARTGRSGFAVLLSRPSVLHRFVERDLILLRFETRDGQEFLAHSELRIGTGELRSLLADGVSSGEEIIGQPVYLREAGVPVVVISRPVLAGRQLAGVVTAVFSLQAIWDKTVRTIPYTAYVLNQDGKLIAHTDREVLGPALESSELIEAFLEGKRDRRVIGFDVRNADGDEVRMLGTRLVTRHQWGVFVQVEEDMAFTPAALMRKKAVRWALGTLVVEIVAALLFAGYITRPIRQLAAASRAFARREFGARVEVSARNEIGELADTYNAMSDELQQHIEQLKAAAEENRELFMGTTRALATAIDEKDPYTRGHSERVNRIALIIGKHLGLDEKELEDLHIAALLHDIGKIGIDDRILRKPAALTDEEFAVMKQHPVRGAKILSGVKALESVIPSMKHHHERFGGGGYPDGLVGEEIPMGARIIMVADAHDAMTTNRAYQRAMRLDAAVARINELSGKVACPKVVEAFNRAFQSGDLKAEALAPGAPTVRAIRQESMS